MNKKPVTLITGYLGSGKTTASKNVWRNKFPSTSSGAAVVNFVVAEPVGSIETTFMEN